MPARSPLLGIVALAATACGVAGTAAPSLDPVATPTAGVEAPANESAPTSGDEPTATATPAVPTPPPTPTPLPSVEVSGTVVSAVDGSVVPGAVVTVGDVTTVTDQSGAFRLEAVADVGSIAVHRPAWEPIELDLPPAPGEVIIELSPRKVKALRVSQEVAADRDRFDELLALADETVVNALVFDTKDESDLVLYDTGVAFAHEIGAVSPVYDPSELLAEARSRGLYAITRIVTFEDPVWADAVPEAHLAGHWVDAADRDNWIYPLDLAVEACELGFDEVQFDYVRFPSGETAARAASLVPQSQAERADAIASFLGEARARLHQRGCGVSAAIFGIVMSSETDERLGQTPETISAVVDAVSPMLYPSHYSPGWLGFADPNDHPGPVVAYALDQGADRIADGSLVRPWIQGFYYDGAQVQAQIAEADQRGAGWIIWNALGQYRRDWLPDA